MEVKSIRKNAQFFIGTEINGAQININYDFSGSTPTQINVSGYYNGNGVSSSMNRVYKADGTYTPVAEAMVYPFNAAFNTALAEHIKLIVANPENPEFTIAPQPIPQV